MFTSLAGRAVVVASREDCRRMAAIAQERLGGIDVLCASAGIFPESSLADLSGTPWIRSSAPT